MPQQGVIKPNFYGAKPDPDGVREPTGVWYNLVRKAHVDEPDCDDQMQPARHENKNGAQGAAFPREGQHHRHEYQPRGTRGDGARHLVDERPPRHERLEEEDEDADPTDVGATVVHRHGCLVPEVVLVAEVAPRELRKYALGGVEVDLLARRQDLLRVRLGQDAQKNDRERNGAKR